MGWIGRLRQKAWFRWTSNIYVLILSLFFLWMLFFDNNSWLIHRDLNKEVEKLENQIQHLHEEIQKDKAELRRLKNADEMERYARERYHMKKENEEVFLIEFEDSIKK